MREEGENPLPQENRGPDYRTPNPGNGQQRRRTRGGRGNGTGGGNRPQYSSNSRSSRQQQWDPRRSEPREPGYANEHKPNPSRPAPVVQVKQRRSLGSFVGALLGRSKPEEEKS
jgi:hypothetical protein